MEKAQAALEFMMTYGWAILAVLLTITALAYFGVLAPLRFTSNTCTIMPGITCVDSKIEESQITLTVKNGIGYDLKDFSIKSNACSGASSTQIAVLSQATLHQVTITGCNFVPGSKIKDEIEITYTEKSLSHTRSGNLVGFVSSATTITTSTTTTTIISFNPTDDSFVNEASSSTNYGSQIGFIVRGDSGQIRRGYLKFNVNSCSGSVLNAILTLTNAGDGCTGSSGNECILLNQVSDTTWSENTITWLNKPVLGSIISSYASVTASSAVTFDVSSIVTTNGLYSFAAIEALSNSDSSTWNSKEASSNKPVLQVTC